MKTLEGEEQVEAGEIWPQTEKVLTRRYQITDEVDADGWPKYRPNPDTERVIATQIDHPFSVTKSWGTLAGKAGDYRLKNQHERNKAFVRILTNPATFSQC